MTFSIFDDDSTFGSVDRITTIQGNGTDNTVFGESAYWFKQQITAAMNENLIGTSGIQVSESGSNIIFEIEVINSTNSSSEQIRQMVQSVLQNRTYLYGGMMPLPVQQRRIFSNVTTRVLRDTGAATTQGGGQQTQPPTYFPFPQQPPAATGGGSSSAGGGSNFLDSLGLGLGISTPVIVGGAALLVLLMLKR